MTSVQRYAGSTYLNVLHLVLKVIALSLFILKSFGGEILLDKIVKCALVNYNLKVEITGMFPHSDITKYKNNLLG